MPTTPRSYGQMVAALVLIVGSALAGALLLTRAGDTSSVLAVGDQVAKGQTIERADLISLQVAGIKGAVPVADVTSVVGKTAAVDLVPRQVITMAQLADGPVPAAGSVLVGLSLKASQMPGDGVAAGDLVRVVAVPSPESAAASDLGAAKVLTSSAQVYSVNGGDVESGGSAGRVVTIIAPETDSATLMSYASTGRAAIVKISAGH